jgi:glycosyltransferase involved in cell wall biosynthesis
VKIFKKIKTTIDDFKDSLLQMEYQQKYRVIETRLENHKELYEKYFPQEIIFTFCMPTYNGEKYIARALESILMQETSYKYQIWILDDCSTDNTVNIVREYMKLYPDVFKLEVNKKNEGGMTVAPKIFNNIKTKYWMNFDQDDYWISKDKLQRSLDFFELHPDFTLVSSNLFIKSSNKLRPSYRGSESSIKFGFSDYPFPLNILFQTSSTMFRNVFTTEDLDHINSYLGTEKQYCILGDTFRNVFALSKGKGYFENSFDSVYNWTETGTWSKLNKGQQEFYNLQYFYNSINFFDNPEYQKQMEVVSKRFFKQLMPYVKMLNEKERKEFYEIKEGLFNAK